MTDERSQFEACATPLLELLRSVPIESCQMIEIHATEHRNIPYGRLCHEAADEIERLQAARASSEAKAAQDVGDLEYMGNSVAYIYQKMRAYKDSINKAWDAMRVAGHHPDGNTPLDEAIAKAFAAQAAPAQPCKNANLSTDAPCKNDDLSTTPAQPVTHTIATAPKRIYLNVFERFEDDLGFPEDHEGVTWCDDKIGDNDVPYVRADLVAAQPAGDPMEEARRLVRVMAETKGEQWDDALKALVKLIMDSELQAQPAGERVLLVRYTDRLVGGGWRQSAVDEPDANSQAVEYAWATIERIP